MDPAGGAEGAPLSAIGALPPATLEPLAPAPNPNTIPQTSKKVISVIINNLSEI